jgi:hypothetical protein
MYLFGALPIVEKMRGGIGNTVFLMKQHVSTLSCEYLQKFSKKIRNGSSGMRIQGLGGN